MNEVKYRTIEKCRVCDSRNLTSVLSLGNLYVSDFFDFPDNQLGIKAPLELVLCNIKDDGCGLLQLKHTVSNESMYRNYWYRSGINKTMTDELNEIAEKSSIIANLQSGDFVIDIGANDGTLLRGYEVIGLNTVGFEPALNLKSFNAKGTTKIIPDFFKKDDWRQEFGSSKAKIITAIGMFYDLDEPNTFVADVFDCLDDDGVFVIQMMYLSAALDRNAFDGICHEHLEYYSLGALENLLKRHNLEVFDIEMREHINEGSVRFYIRKKGKGANLTTLEGAHQRLSDLREKESIQGLNDVNVYKALVARVLGEREKIVSFIKKEVGKGKVIHGYAASTKGNTTLQFYGLDSNLIEMIADRNPSKDGKFTAGSLIPVVSEDKSRKLTPDYYLILAWHFLPEFLDRESEYLKAGGKFIVPMPSFKVLDLHSSHE